MALQGVYRRGLSNEIRDELAVREDAQSLDELVELAICLDDSIRERHTVEREDHRGSHSVPLVSYPLQEVAVLPNRPPPVADVSAAVSGSKEAVQLGRSRLTPQERRGHMTQWLCSYCGQEEHFLDHCPEVPGNRGMLVSPTSTSSKTLDQIQLRGVTYCSLPVHCLEIITSCLSP